MLLQIRYYGDPVLRKKAEPVTEVTDAIRKIGEDLIETMYAEKGIGLAAPQVGLSYRMLAVDAGENRGRPCVWINPEIVALEDEVLLEEGCLSFPGIYGKVVRAAKVTVRGLGLSGEAMEMTLDAMECRTLLHEMDHLEGILFIDRMAPTHKIVISSKLKKLAKQTKQELQTA